MVVKIDASERGVTWMRARSTETRWRVVSLSCSGISQRKLNRGGMGWSPILGAAASKQLFKPWRI